MSIPNEAQKIIETSPYREELQKIVNWLNQTLTSYQIKPTELQYVIMINHISEMFRRSKQKEPIPTVDKEMFSEISPLALQLAKQTVDLITGLSEDEIYVLSIHFETAKNN